MKTIEQHVLDTEDAYSFYVYGAKSWGACFKMLRRRGYDDRQAESVMRSKHTRWAADASGKPYGKTTSRDLERYMDKHPSYFTEVEVLRLVVGTFNEGG